MSRSLRQFLSDQQSTTNDQAVIKETGNTPNQQTITDILIEELRLRSRACFGIDAACLSSVVARPDPATDDTTRDSDSNNNLRTTNNKCICDRTKIVILVLPVR